MVLELGGNDGLRGIDLSLTRANLGAIIERTRNAWPQARIVLVGMRVPPNLGPDYTEEFASIYPEVSAEYDTYFAPFIADGFEDIVHLLQNDGIHPTEEGHAVIAEKVGDVVEPLVAELDKTS
jgi:acyl-CoA thioesterase-1